jgi:DNA-binding NarL/FixJ family response regulator
MQMKSRRVTGPGKRALRVAPRVRRPAAGDWKASSAVLISRTSVAARGRTARGRKGKAVHIFLIDDNRLLLDGLTSMLEAQGLKVIATARSGVQAVRQVKRLQPDVVLLDSALGDRTGVKLVQSFKQSSPSTRIIVMHLLPAHEDVIDFVQAGVSGFIMKDASASDFMATIKSVADGASVLPPRMATSLFSHVADQVVLRKRSTSAATRMTAREREVTALIAEGLGNREIADRLDIASHTVKSHVHNILEKLALHTRLEVAAYAHASGKRKAPR